MIKKISEVLIKIIALFLSFLHKIVKFIKKNPVIFIIFLLAFALRASGVYPGFPDYHPDEGTSYSKAIHMFFNFLRPDHFDYPAGMALLHLIIYLIFILPFVFLKMIIVDPSTILTVLGLGDFPFISLKEEIFGKVGIHALYWSRYIAASVGTAAVVLTYFTAKRLFNKEVGIFAAFFLAVNYRHVFGSHFGLPDVHNSFFNVLSLFASIMLLQKNTKGRYVFAGIAAALAFSIKYQPFGFLPFFFVHILWAIKKKSLFYLFNRYFTLAMFASFITFILINPYYFFNLDEVIYQNQKDYHWYQMGNIYFRPYPYWYLFYFGIGILPTIAIIFGIVLMVFRKLQKALLLLSFVVAVFFVMTIYSNGGIYPRNFVNVIPYLMIFAGFFMFQIAVFLRKMLKERYVLLLVFAFLVIVNFSPIKNSVIASYSMAKPWTATVLADWLKNNLPKNSTIRHYELRFSYEEMQSFLAKKPALKGWYYDRGFNSLAEFQEEGTDFAIVNTASLQNVTYWWRGYPQLFIGKNNVPFDYIENGFYGLTIREFRNYSVYEVYKPWQALETNNYVVFKIPHKPKELGERIAYIDFSNNEKNWKIMGNFGFEPPRVYWDSKEGNMQAGSIALFAGQSATSRVVFSPISVVAGRLYTVKGSIKNTIGSSGLDLDGFLRIDFYKDKNEKTIEKKSIAVAISQRAMVDENWHEVSASMLTPENAKYMTVSTQLRDTTAALYVDDIEVFETDKIPEETFKKVPYIKSAIPLGSLYYDSFL